MAKGKKTIRQDFAFFQEVLPSCYFGLGNGESASLHDARYDFNDELLVNGPKIWAEIVERFLKPGA